MNRFNKTYKPSPSAPKNLATTNFKANPEILPKKVPIEVILKLLIIFDNFISPINDLPYFF